MIKVLNLVVVRLHLILSLFVLQHVFHQHMFSTKRDNYLKCRPITLLGKICDFRSKISFVDSDDPGESKVARLPRSLIACSTTRAQNCDISMMPVTWSVWNATSIVSSMEAMDGVGWVVVMIRDLRSGIRQERVFRHLKSKAHVLIATDCVIGFN